MNRIFIFIFCSIALILVSSFHFFKNSFDDYGYVYPLDDTYIHLAMSKNFAQNGVWGVTKHEFSSSSSSPMFVFLNVLGIITFGHSTVIPFALNLIIAIVLFYMIFFYINYNNGYKEAILGIIILYITLPVSANIYNGMEHLLHILFTFIFLLLYVRYKMTGINSRAIYFIAFLLVTIRYESLFLLSVVTTLEIMERKFNNAVYLFFFAVLPVLIYGLISIINGDMFLPYSILLKGDIPHNNDKIFSIPIGVFNKLSAAPHLAGLLVLNIILTIYIASSRKFKSLNFKLLIITIFTSIFHLVFAKVGWVYRYEAYLILLNIFAIYEYWRSEHFYKNYHKLIFIILFTLALIPSISRYIETLYHLPKMSKNIHDQQLMMSKFLSENYNNSPVVLNDIGACCYYTNIYLTDLVGIADREIVKLRITKKFNSDEIDNLTTKRGSKIAIIYAEGFEGYIPTRWTKVATMTIRDNLGCAYDSVSFFAISADSLFIKDMKLKLANFGAEIPNDVNLSFQ